MPDIFLFQTGINKQPAKRARQEIEKQDSFVTGKQKNPDIVEKLKRDLPLFRCDDRLHRRGDRPRCHDNRLRRL